MEIVLDDGDGFTREYVQFFNLCTLHIPFGPRRQKKKCLPKWSEIRSYIYIVFLKGLAEFWSFSLFVSLAHSDH